MSCILSNSYTLSQFSTCDDMHSTDHAVSRCPSVCYLLALCSSSRMRVTNHHWSARKQHLICRVLPFSFVRGQDPTMWDMVWVAPQRHKSVSVSRHFLLQAPQCPCSVQKQYSVETAKLFELSGSYTILVFLFLTKQCGNTLTKDPLMGPSNAGGMKAIVISGQCLDLCQKL